MTNCDAVPICYLGSDPFFGKRDGWLLSSLENRDSADGSSSDRSSDYAGSPRWLDVAPSIVAI
ncbi:MAG: hypothetical protein RMZ43_018965 [Nostoc sp. CmiVER01]|uniref:hypothetical protein n=1 Tax=Nostoc sp. CmiVER01 TaxID=3075384 RepID=UPI002AD2D4E6|nr:hypothetical protein [Nostoc sp. CmiVER01]MDZ8126749.1 hypothetical protein [Nostoc sp. CmiVER01]